MALTNFRFCDQVGSRFVPVDGWLGEVDVVQASGGFVPVNPGTYLEVVAYWVYNDHSFD